MDATGNITYSLYVRASELSAGQRSAGHTRTALMTVARALFTARGYAERGHRGDRARSADVTRGALYHHFTDKRELFRAVHEQVEQDMVAAITAAMAGIEDPVELLLAGGRAFLDLCDDPNWTRIPLIDAPSVLGWAEWREIDMRYGLGLVSAGAQGGHGRRGAQARAGAATGPPAAGGLGEPGLTIATAEDRRAEREEAEATLVGLIDGA